MSSKISSVIVGFTETSDAAINVWNGLGLLRPEVARNTLLSVLENQEGRIRIGGQFWDAMIWSLGAWSYYLYTGDWEFLSLAFEAVCNSLAYFETEEYDAAIGLFRGPAVYGDGVSAYPDRYSPGGSSSTHGLAPSDSRPLLPVYIPA